MMEPVMVTHAFNASIQVTDRPDLFEFKARLAEGQPGLQSRMVSEQNKKNQVRGKRDF